MTHALTDLERRVYSYVKHHFERDWRSPTTRGIALGLGLKGVACVNGALNRLVDLKFLVKDAKNGRIIGLSERCPSCGQTYPETTDERSQKAGAAGHVAGNGAATQR